MASRPHTDPWQDDPGQRRRQARPQREPPMPPRGPSGVWWRLGLMVLLGLILVRVWPSGVWPF